MLVAVVIELAGLAFASEESSSQINRQRYSEKDTLSGGTWCGMAKPSTKKPLAFLITPMARKGSRIKLVIEFVLVAVNVFSATVLIYIYQ